MSTRRTTRQQQAVSSILERHGDFRSAQEWHALLRESGEAVGLATVYRTLQTLADEGTIDVLRSPAGEAVYRAGSLTASYFHAYFPSCPQAAAALLGASA